MEVLNELFSVPVGLEKVISINGAELYGSVQLTVGYNEVLVKAKNTAPLSDILLDLVKNRRIIPCYLNKGIFRVLMWIIFSEDPEKSTMAFFHPKENKVFIVIDNKISLAGYISNEWLGNVTLHECSHMAAYDNPSGFFKIFSNDLVNFYSAYFTEIFKLKKSAEKYTIKIVHYLREVEENRMNRKLKEPDTLLEVKKLLSELKKDSDLSDDHFESILKDYVDMCSLLLNKMTSKTFSELIKRKRVIVPYYHAYTKVFGVTNQDAFHFQESLYPSEVIAIYSEVAPKEKLASMLSLIKK